MEKFIVSARKYRPATFSTLIGQEGIATTLKNSIRRNQLAHAYLFCGPRGVGKTTTARIFAKTINCTNPGEDLEPCGECESCKSFAEGRSYCIHELDAASNNSVDDIRALTERVVIPPQIGKYGVYIIDEVHMLSTAAFNAFLKTLEEPPAHAIFILATTEKQKIIPTILSRCQVFDFNRISVPDIVKNLKWIAEKEGVTIDDNSLHVIAQKADGAMRDALTLFDQVIAYCGKSVVYESVIKNLNVLDHEYYFKLVNYSLEGKYAESLLLFDEVLSKGFNAHSFIGGLWNHLRNLLVCKESASAKLLEESPAVCTQYMEQTARCSLNFLFKAIAVVERCDGDYSRSNNQRLLVEFMLVRLSSLSAPVATPQEKHPVQTPPVQPPSTTITDLHKEREAKGAEQQPAQQQAAQQQQEASPAEKKQLAQSTTTKQEEREKEATPHTEEPTKSTITNPGISITNLLKETESPKKEEGIQKEEEKDRLRFMGPATNEPVTQEGLVDSWRRMVEFFAEKYPKLVMFVATIKNTKPYLTKGDAEDNHTPTVVFEVGNTKQKEWIEKYTAEKMANFLRQSLKNNNLKLSVKIKSREEIERKLYLPEEKEAYLQKTNPEFDHLKKDLGMDLT